MLRYLPVRRVYARQDRKGNTGEDKISAGVREVYFLVQRNY